MKKTNKIALLLPILVLTMFSKTQTVSAASSGYERYTDNQCDVFFEYLPCIPFNPYYPTASEEFAFTYEITQYSYWKDVRKFCPWGFELEVWFANLDGDEDFTTWKRWYPLSMQHHGRHISWSLSGGYGPLNIGATVSVPDLNAIETNYTEYTQNCWLRLAFIDVYYNWNWFWDSATCSGGGSIGIQNDLAELHNGNWCLVRVDLNLWWQSTTLGVWQEKKALQFVFGDDNPSDTDCILTLEEGDTKFYNHVYAPQPDTTGHGGWGGCASVFKIGFAGPL